MEVAKSLTFLHIIYQHIRLSSCQSIMLRTIVSHSEFPQNMLFGSKILLQANAVDVIVRREAKLMIHNL